MEDTKEPGRRIPRPPALTMDELRARFGRALRDQNFWQLMDQLEAEAAPCAPPDHVVAFPAERASCTAPTDPDSGPGKVILGRFSRR